MAAEDGQPEPVAAGPAADGLMGDVNLIGQAQWLGQQHRAAGIAPFGDVGYVVWDEGSARLLSALGVTSPTTDDNAPGRFGAAAAYCDALGTREAGDIEPGS